MTPSADLTADIATAIVVVLALGAVLCVLRILRAETLADAVVAVDLLLLVIISLVAVDAAATQRATFLDVPLVIGLLGFLGTSSAAVYLRRRAATPDGVTRPQRRDGAGSGGAGEAVR